MVVSGYRYQNPLSPEQLAVLIATSNGKTVKEIAEMFGHSVNSVKQRRSRIIGKLCARNMEHAIAIAVREGIIS